MKSIKFTFLGKAFMLAFLSFGLVNCDKDKVEEEVVPDFSSTFKNVAIKPITVSKPATTTYVAGSIVIPPTVAAVNTDLAAGKIPTTLETAGSKIPDAITKAVNNLLTPAVLADIKAGKGIPSSISGRLDAAINAGAFNAFRPTIILPKLNDKPVGNRFAAPGSTNTVKAEQEMFSTMNACNDAVKKAFDAAKKILDDGKAAEIAKIITAYEAYIKTADVTKEKADALSRKNASIAAYNTALNIQLASMDNLRKSKLYNEDQIQQGIAGLIGIFRIVSSYSEELYLAELKALDARSEDIEKKGKDARDKDIDKLNGDYDLNLGGISLVYKNENEKCHNQGGGN